MVASSVEGEPGTPVFARESVGNTGYRRFHDQQMFAEGRSFSGYERDKLWFNRGDATFADLSNLSGCDSPNDGRAAIAADFDDDGDVDLFVNNLQRERHALYRNEIGLAHGSFVKIRLRATRSQYEAIGATVTLHGPRGPLAQVMSRGGGFSACQVPELVFGLGQAEAATAEVRWPSGAVESFAGLAAGARMLLVEGSGKAESFAARTARFRDPLPTGLKIRVGARVPVLRAVDSAGKAATIDLATLGNGRSAYLNFWATYCAPCVAEIPDLQSIHASSKAVVIGMCVEEAGRREAAAALLRKRGGDYPSYFLSGDPGTGAGIDVSEIVDLERLPIPTTLVVSPEGVLEAVIRGPVGKR